MMQWCDKADLLLPPQSFQKQHILKLFHSFSPAAICPPLQFNLLTSYFYPFILTFHVVECPLNKSSCQLETA